ncbi:hypothetical protein G4H71_01215 [Rhodococcus triatomae]|uniref:Lipoprotein n=1 Tax=Rhodococcus triatomae TaxID=300028 RepID=A0A1G8DAP1_9NOCA|nr:hypothetical protein [Rhodococcus triatomae]QNG18467.1 hypothetical protein G4H72_06835 [Rhodococcus triatomae]QNG21864.1 hypothetical protein G4H71_01215 [Rhodococcus triatomae]SDH54634.1 hypothetical protein SAMN05444695_102248 [Rhodococcus triatomae]
MPRPSWRVAGATGAAVAALAAAVACGSPAPAPEPTPTQSEQQPPSGTAPAAGGVTEAQAAALCGDLEGQLQSWRTYTPTIGKTGLNGLVLTWIAQNGLNPIEFAQDRARIDAITTAACPQVRQEAITALEIPDLASGLIGL